jgi:tRNA(fMet)-specific endonuclease VapC
MRSIACLVFAARLEAAVQFGEINAHLLETETQARSLDLTLVTNNRREFERMPGLRVENWAA